MQRCGYVTAALASFLVERETGESTPRPVERELALIRREPAALKSQR